MGTAERREAIMRIMFMRRHETAENLAFEFGVSVKTILRDIKVLEAAYKPIYMTQGRHGGGIHIVDGCNNNTLYIKQSDEEIFRKIYSALEGQYELLGLDETTITAFRKVIDKYSIPK